MNVVIPQAPEVLKDKQYHSNVSYVIPPPTLYILHYTVYLCMVGFSHSVITGTTLLHNY